MRCLSVRQPWAWAICAGVKPVENKSNRTSHRGLVAIHASRNKATLSDFVGEDGDVDPAFFTFGAIIGCAELVEVVEMNRDLESEPTAFGPICWLLRNPKLFTEAIPAKGQLGLFNLTPDQEREVRRQMERPGRETPERLLQWFRGRMGKDPAEDLVERASRYMGLAKLEDTFRLCNQALEIDPNHFDAYSYRAFVHLETGRLTEAIRDYDKAIELEPDNPFLYRLRAEAHRRAGNEDLARKDLESFGQLGGEDEEGSELEEDES